MKKIIITCAMALAIVVAQAQTVSFDEILQQVEINSKALQAMRKYTDAQSLEANTDRFLPNPTVEYEYLWGGQRNRINEGELTVAQAFDFPTAYGARKQLARLRADVYEKEGAVFRLQLLLEAKLLCCEIVYRQKQDVIFREKLENAQRLERIYQQKFEVGEANIIEYNKIKLEFITAQTDRNLNLTALQADLRRLENYLGGSSNAQDPSGAAYIGKAEESENTHGLMGYADRLMYPIYPLLPSYELLESLFLDPDANPEIDAILRENSVYEKTVQVNRSMSMPKLQAGYRHNFGMEGRYKGFIIGMSIPMFENKNKVKAARAMTVYGQAQLESNRVEQSSGLKQLYEQASLLLQSGQAVQNILDSQNNLELLNRALEEGQISVIDYFTEIRTLYETREKLLEMERDYQLVSAQLYKFLL